MKKGYRVGSSLSMLLSVVFALLLAGMPVSAEVYKWVDKNGKVHFGDKPKENEALEKSEVVDLKETNLSENNQALIEQRKVRNERLTEQAEELKRQQAENDKVAAQKNATKKKCQELREKLKGFTQVRFENGRRVNDYFIEDGKAVSSKRQKEIVAALEKKINKRCSKY